MIPQLAVDEIAQNFEYLAAAHTADKTLLSHPCGGDPPPSEGKSLRSRKRIQVYDHFFSEPFRMKTGNP